MSRSLTVAAACLALFLTACGRSDKPKAAKSTATPAEATAAATSTSTSDEDANHCTPAKNPGQQKRAKLDKPDEKLDASHTYVATVDTNCGTFEITLDAKRAPKTGGSFKFLADQGFYDGLLIHRIVPGFVFQGGDPLGTGLGGPGYQVVEAPPKDLKYRKYVVAMAKAANDPPGASGSQFSIVVTGEDGETLTPDYALLGEVTSGPDVADKIGAIITDPRSDFPDAPVLINSIKKSRSPNRPGSRSRRRSSARPRARAAALGCSSPPARGKSRQPEVLRATSMRRISASKPFEHAALAPMATGFVSPSAYVSAAFCSGAS